MTSVDSCSSNCSMTFSSFCLYLMAMGYCYGDKMECNSMEWNVIRYKRGITNSCHMSHVHTCKRLIVFGGLIIQQAIMHVHIICAAVIYIHMGVLYFTVFTDLHKFPPAVSHEATAHWDNDHEPINQSINHAWERKRWRNKRHKWENKRRTIQRETKTIHFLFFSLLPYRTHSIWLEVCQPESLELCLRNPLWLHVVHK